MSLAELERVKPIYEEHAGWQTPTTGCRSWNDLPEKAQAYLMRIQELLGVPLAYVSVGPGREQTIRLNATS
jgi:adenylosuccinate synthase